jgi:hypothetical protein
MKVAPETTLYGIYIQLHEIRRKIGQIRDAIMTNGITTIADNVIVSILNLIDEYETNAISAKKLLYSEKTNQPTTAHNMLARINHVTDTVSEYVDDIYNGVIMRRCRESFNDTTSSASYQ